MKTQIVTNRLISSSDCVVSRFNSVKTFDSFDYNVIDLSCEDVWRYNGDSIGCSNLKLDITSISKMISSSKKTRFVFVLPCNVLFRYYYNILSKSYNRSLYLKDSLSTITTIVSEVIKINYALEYEPNETDLNGESVHSDFYFSYYPEEANNILKSLDSEKVVSFVLGNCAYTTLDIVNIKMAIDFINKSFCYETEDIPEWFDRILFNDDAIVNKTIEDNRRIIAEKTEENNQLDNKLSLNNHYKMILVSTGDHLVQIVFDIFQQILGVELHSFVDKKKEDFHFRLDDRHFVGEIKGVNENVKNKHLSELEHNKQEYCDNNSVEAKGLLIINHQRSLFPSDRIEINNDQIQYSVRDKLLIIESTTLLNIFEAYLNGKLDVKSFKDVLWNKTGLLKDEWRKD